MTPEEALQKINEYREKNRIKAAKYYEKNKDKVREYAREYQRKRRDIVEQAKKIVEEKNNSFIPEKTF